MNYEQMSERLQKILVAAVEQARNAQHPSVDTIDLLQVIFEDDVLDGLFTRINLDKQRALEIIAEENQRIVKSPTQNLNFSNEVNKSFEKASKWAMEHEETYLSVASVFLALLFNKS